MASRRPFTYPRFQAFDSNGAPLSGGTAEFFDAGTTTNRDIYSDAALTTTAPNPVTLNSRGEPESGGGTAIDVYLDNEPYKIVLKDSSGSTVWTIDNYLESEDPADATDQSTDVFEGVLNRDPTSGEIFKVDFQSANTTTAPTFENTGGSLGALTVKTRDGGELWAGAINRVHELLYDGTDLLVLDPDSEQGSSPEHATDGGTDAFVSATNTGTPGTGVTIVRDFQSTNTTTTPTLDGVTIKTRDGSALWAGAIDGPHRLKYDGTDYLLLDPILAQAEVYTQEEIDAYTIKAMNDGGTDAYTIDLGTDVVSGNTFIVLVDSANTTSSPTLEHTGGSPGGAIQILDSQGNAWIGMLQNRVHRFRYSGAAPKAYIVLDPVHQIIVPKTNSGSVSSVDISIPVGTVATHIYVNKAVSTDDGETLEMRVRPEGGSFDTGVSDYSSRGTQDGTAFSSTSSALEFNNDGVGNAAGEFLRGVITVIGARDSNTRTHVHTSSLHENASGTSRITHAVCYRTAAQAEDAVRIFWSANNLNPLLYSVVHDIGDA